MSVNLYRTCYVAGKNGQKYIPVDRLAENKSVTDRIGEKQKPCIVVNTRLLIYYFFLFGSATCGVEVHFHLKESTISPEEIG